MPLRYNFPTVSQRFDVRGVNSPTTENAQYTQRRVRRGHVFLLALGGGVPLGTQDEIRGKFLSSFAFFKIKHNRRYEQRFESNT